jgi:hypothetical protein
MSQPRRKAVTKTHKLYLESKGRKRKNAAKGKLKPDSDTINPTSHCK